MSQSKQLTEADIMRLCMIEATRLGARMFRNNVGTANTDKGFIRFGLCIGSSDLIGIYKGKFVAIEVKRPCKKPTPEQENFINMVRRMGGIAGICTCVEDVRNLLTLNSGHDLISHD
jgi:hypothetical protein